MSNRLRHYLLTFDHRRGRLLNPPVEFVQTDEAIRAYTAAEARYDSDDRVEVVLIGSDSLATVKKTHPNFFGATPLARYLRAI